MNRNWILALIVAFGLGYGINSYLDNQKASERQKQAVINENIAINPTFHGVNNQAVKIFDSSDKRIRVAYFGFTRCADVCPTSLAMLSAALNQIEAEELKQLRPMFISIDPERDEPAAAHKYAQYFHSTIEGLSAPLSITKPVADKYGVIFRKTELKESAIDYVVDHSSYFYFLKPDGSLITKVPHTLDPATIINAIKTVLKNNKTSNQ